MANHGDFTEHDVYFAAAAVMVVTTAFLTN